MKTENPHYFNTYAFFFKFFLLIISFLFVVSCMQKPSNPVSAPNGGKLSAETAVNINTATASELEKLPFIGSQTARKIVEHREKYGRFRRAEHLLLIQGVSDKKFRQMRNMITAE
jgi:competence ComEA-like helix-hairpin-helix protein